MDFFPAFVGVKTNTGSVVTREAKQSVPNETPASPYRVDTRGQGEQSVIEYIQMKWPLLSDRDIEISGLSVEFLAVRIVERYGISMDWATRYVEDVLSEAMSTEYLHAARSS